LACCLIWYGIIWAKAKQALYDNLNQDEELVNKIDEVIKTTKEDGTWGNMMKERKLRIAIKKTLVKQVDKLDEIMEIIKNQDEYR